MGTSSIGHRGNSGWKRLRLTTPCRSAHAIHGTTASYGEISHVETFLAIAAIPASQGHQFIEGNPQSIRAIRCKVGSHHILREAIEAGFDRRVRGKEISCPRYGQCDGERMARVFHIAGGSLKHGERRVAFVQMTDFRLNIQRSKQPPTADSQHVLLSDPQLRTSAVKLARDPAIFRNVCRIVSVEQVEPGSPNLDFPRPNPERAARETGSTDGANRHWHSARA